MKKQLFTGVLLVLWICSIVYLWLSQRDYFWVFMTVFLITIMFILPIIKHGFLDGLFYLYQMNPLAKSVIGLFIYLKECKLSSQWFARIEALEDKKFPIVNWTLSKFYSHGIYSFYLLDQYSDDVRQLLHSPFDVVRDDKLWFRAKFSNKYLFQPQWSPSPRYEVVSSGNSLEINTASQKDTWVYLVSRYKYPKTYALEFDYIPHSDMRETLQIGFCCHSLARRFRFNLIDNRMLTFEVVDKACFTFHNLRRWNKFKKKCSLPLHRSTHIRLEVIRNIFILYFNGKLEMAVNIKGYEPQETHCYLIFWNGSKYDQGMRIELGNFKIFTDSKDVFC